METEEKKRTFTLDEKLLEEFKKQSTAASKSYKQTVKEAIQLWLDYYQKNEKRG